MSGGDRHSRYAAATGIFFVVLVVIGFLVQPKPPSSDASAVEVLEYVKDHHDALHVIQLIFGLAGFFFIWFIGALRSLLGGGAPSGPRTRNHPGPDRRIASDPGRRRPRGSRLLLRQRSQRPAQRLPA